MTFLDLTNLIDNKHIKCFKEKLHQLTSETYLFHPRRGNSENRIDVPHTNNTIIFAYNRNIEKSKSR